MPRKRKTKWQKYWEKQPKKKSFFSSSNSYGRKQSFSHGDRDTTFRHDARLSRYIPQIPNLGKPKTSKLAQASTPQRLRGFEVSYSTKKDICQSRSERRKYLFASGKAGKIKVKKAHWTSDSRVVCS